MKDLKIVDRIPGTENGFFGTTRGGPSTRLRIDADKGATAKRKQKSRAKAKAARAARKAQR